MKIDTSHCRGRNGRGVRLGLATVRALREAGRTSPFST